MGVCVEVLKLHLYMLDSISGVESISTQMCHRHTGRGVPIATAKRATNRCNVGKLRITGQFLLTVVTVACIAYTPLKLILDRVIRDIGIVT